MTQHDTDMTHPPRVTVEDAAQLLGVSVDAVRKRIERGTLQSERVGKTRYVLLDETDMTEHDTARTRHDSDMTPLVEELRSHNAYLREQLDKEREANRENRRLLAAALERIPALEEAPPEPRDAPTPAAEERGGGEVPQDDRGDSRAPSWWRRMFGTARAS